MLIQLSWVANKTCVIFIFLKLQFQSHPHHLQQQQQQQQQQQWVMMMMIVVALSPLPWGRCDSGDVISSDNVDYK